MLEPRPVDTASSDPSDSSLDDGLCKKSPEELLDNLETGQVHQPPETPKETLQRQMKRVVGPRVYSMITGETSPLENRQINLLMANLEKLPEHIRDALLKKRSPVTDLIKMVHEQATSLNQLVVALLNAESEFPSRRCPFCNQAKSFIQKVGNVFQGSCGECGATGPQRGSYDEALRAWDGK
jgi:hypothetical protein